MCHHVSPIEKINRSPPHSLHANSLGIRQAVSSTHQLVGSLTYVTEAGIVATTGIVPRSQSIIIGSNIGCRLFIDTKDGAVTWLTGSLNVLIRRFSTASVDPHSVTKVFHPGTVPSDMWQSVKTNCCIPVIMPRPAMLSRWLSTATAQDHTVNEIGQPGAAFSTGDHPCNVWRHTDSWRHNAIGPICEDLPLKCKNPEWLRGLIASF